MKIKITVKTAGNGDDSAWTEELDTSTSYHLNQMYEEGDTADVLAKKLIDWFNDTLGPREKARVLLGVEEITETAPEAVAGSGQ